MIALPFRRDLLLKEFGVGIDGEAGLERPGEVPVAQKSVHALVLHQRPICWLSHREFLFLLVGWRMILSPPPSAMLAALAASG